MAAPGDGLCILDFGSFTTALESDPDGTEAARWFVQAAQFYECLKRYTDFRLVRMRILVVYLTEMRKLLQPKRIDRSHISTAKAYRHSFDTISGGPKWAQTPLPSGALSIHR